MPQGSLPVHFVGFNRDSPGSSGLGAFRFWEPPLLRTELERRTAWQSCSSTPNDEGSPQSGHRLSRQSCAAMFISSRCAAQARLPRRTGTSQPGQPHGTIVSGLSVGSFSKVTAPSLPSEAWQGLPIAPGVPLKHQG